ncbi:thioredoxin-domain-containing protein [Mollisia scopiformis]|uniref:protein disulfide-isomerase n=1 Tax=Mollisia scopiformis TaxID=149040 RepID=A0A194XX70_MOLSC|nr:thioredoxin-domain-containing protein [Mollisia scopiformis]KUJ24689.1 thioredoxin-domain-containing protein [Mollisia scopiformis]
MVYTTAIVAALLAALPVNAGLYPKSSKVVQVDAKSYDRLIAQSNYTSIVEFYAPWCGHCKNLQPAYEKAAINLLGLAKVAAFDCDDESNKAFCGGMGVKGFPTLKIVKPGKTPGKPIVEDYNGERTAKGIVDAVIDKIPNHVKRVEDKNLEAWLEEANETAKAILFTDKGKTSALLKSIAIDFKGSISVAQIRNTDKEKASLELFGVSKFPTLILLPGGKEAEGIVYDGEMKKDPMVAFLSQAASPNPDPAPAKVKLPKSKDSKKSKAKAKESFEEASKTHASEEGKTNKATATDETLVEEATESPSPEVETEKPVDLPVPAPAIGILETETELEAECLGSRTGTCILALLPSTPDEIAATAVGSLSEIAHRHKQHQRKLFPFYVLPEKNTGYKQIKDALALSDMAIIAVNGRRGWWRTIPVTGDKISDKDVTEEAIENWVDSIRLGEGAKQKLPEGLIPEEPEETTTEEESTSSKTPAPSEEPIVVEEVKVEEKTEQKPIDDHDEL